MRLLVTGASGYVGSLLLPLLKKRHNVMAIDMVMGEHTDIASDIAADDLGDKLNSDENYIVIHCAAARFDYGISADVYFEENVIKTRAFLKTLSALNVTQFIHISSVAAIDGKAIAYHDGLDCDNAYRSTKYLQQCEVVNWCMQNNVAWDVVMPSAIYDDTPRSDTNIGKLQSITRLVPLLPKIEVKKSLTYLPRFCAFIEQLIGKSGSSYYLTIERPVQTVTETMRDQAGRKVWAVPVPGLKIVLFLLSWMSLGLALLVGRDPILTPSRVIKLFSDTSYDKNETNIDSRAYHRSST